ncbi:MAG: N-acetylmuramoyl-L-alanine amidase, partial [Planctomycetota bacterium]
MRSKTLLLAFIIIGIMTGGCAGRLQQAGRDAQKDGEPQTGEEPSYEIYYVKEGDTVRSIGRRFGVDSSRIVEVNDLSQGELSIGQTLLIPQHGGRAKTSDPTEDQSQRPARKSRSDLDGRVVIDAGHGGKDPGAISPNGLREKDINLAVANEVARLLRRDGMDVIRVRDGDTFVELNERAEIANRNEADLFVSIHADSSTNAGARGYTVYVSRQAPRNAHRAAESVLSSMGRTGMENRGVRTADYRVLVKTRCPAVLVELGFLSNRKEANELANATIARNSDGVSV